MKFTTYSLPAFAVCALLLTSCDEDVSQIGSSLTENQTNIIVDSIFTDLRASSVFNETVSTRSTAKLLGRFQSPDYGSISCGFASQLMCSSKLGLPDSITVSHIDSLNFIFQAARGSFTGDSLAPQKLSMFNLEKQLPANISSSFNPDGYYSPSSPVASRPYTLSAIAETDSILLNGQVINIALPLPPQQAKNLFNLYSSRPEIFEWPQNLAKIYPGILVEQTFGNGCLATLSGFRAFLYYHYTIEKSVYKDDKYTTELEVKRDSIAVFSSAPEVTSASTIRYTPSDYLKSAVAEGKCIITTPVGYRVNFTFPASEVLASYNDSSHKLAMVSNLSMKIPAEPLKNSDDFGVSPYLLMVKRSEAEEFFSQNKVPDNVSSFYAAYSSDNKCYNFSSLRSYLLQLIEKNGHINADDTDFVLIPVNITTEQYTDPDTYKVVTVVTRCTPYIEKPTMMQLDMKESLITFTYTLQSIK